MISNGELAVESVVAAPELRKLGPGTLTLKANAFSGILRALERVTRIEGDTPANFGAIEVGSTLAATGVDAALSLGSSSLIVENYLVFRSGTLQEQLASPNDFGRVSAMGLVLLDALVNLALDVSFDPVDGVDTFPILAKAGTGLIGGAGRFAHNGQALNEGAHFVAGSQEFAISYTGGDGNDVVLYAVPEPATALLLGLGVLCFTRRRLVRARRKE